MNLGKLQCTVRVYDFSLIAYFSLNIPENMKQWKDLKKIEHCFKLGTQLCGHNEGPGSLIE